MYLKCNKVSIQKKGEIKMRIASKNTWCGLVEVKQSGASYALYVAGQLKMSSYDLNFIMDEYDKY